MYIDGARYITAPSDTRYTSYTGSDHSPRYPVYVYVKTRGLLSFHA